MSFRKFDVVVFYDSGDNNLHKSLSESLTSDSSISLSKFM